MLASLAFVALVELGGAERHLPSHLDELAAELALVCDEPGPRESPSGAECVRALAVTWWMETRLSDEPPRSRQHGCGAGQVIPTVWRSSRVGRWPTPPCVTLEVLRFGLASARDRLRLAWARSRSPREAFERYNGSHLRRWYGNRARALLAAISR